jgi:hypothetical protein
MAEPDFLKETGGELLQKPCSTHTLGLKVRELLDHAKRRIQARLSSPSTSARFAWHKVFTPEELDEKDRREEQRKLKLRTARSRCQGCGKDFPVEKWQASHRPASGYKKYCSPARAGLQRRKQSQPPIEFNEEKFYFKSNGSYQSSKTGRSLQLAIWEYHYGRVPAGYKLCLKNRDRSSCAIDNLYLRQVQPTPNCSAGGCERKAQVRGLCTKHYQRLRAKERRGWY